MRRRIYTRYLAVLAVVGILGGLAGVVMRLNTFGCRAEGLSNGAYIATCETRRYGDFEHGAYYFALRPHAIAALKRATVLFLGNSRLQAAFSGEEVRRHFAATSLRHYLLGFGHAEESGFAEALARRHDLAPKAVVINADPFFTGKLSAAASEIVLSPAGSERNYRIKALWQELHRFGCARLGLGTTSVCNRNPTVFRRDEDGHWAFAGFDFTRVTAAERYRDGGVTREAFERYVAQARAVMSALKVPPQCVILTEAPASEPPRGLARPLASALGAHAVLPDVTGLETFDRSHLTPESASRWAAEFLRLAGPVIEACHRS